MPSEPNNKPRPTKKNEPSKWWKEPMAGKPQGSGGVALKHKRWHGMACPELLVGEALELATALGLALALGISLGMGLLLALTLVLELSLELAPWCSIAAPSMFF